MTRWELGKIEQEHHDDEDALHMLWGTRIGKDDKKTIIDENSNYDDTTGLAFHVGSPEAPNVNTVEDEFGIMVARDEYSPSDFSAMQSVSMHELGHALSIGWADDAPIPFVGSVVGRQAYEVYSGSTDSDLAGGVDPTPERINTNPQTEWSIMSRISGIDTRREIQLAPRQPVFAFSLEELSTVDFTDIPSQSN